MKTKKTIFSDEKHPVTLTIEINSVVKILAQFEPNDQVIFIYLLPQAAQEIRQQLKMKDRSAFFFDPCSPGTDI